MKQFQVKPTIQVYSTLLNAYSLERNTKEIQNIIEQMKEEGIKPNSITYIASLLI